MYENEKILVIYIYIYSWESKLLTVVEGDPKSSFLIATTPRCREGHNSFPMIDPLYPRYVPYVQLVPIVFHIYIYTYIYIYIYIYSCVFVCLCLCLCSIYNRHKHFMGIILNNYNSQNSQVHTHVLNKSEFADLSRGLPEGFLFNSYYASVGEGATPFPVLFHFTLDPYLIILSATQDGIKYHFLSL